MRYVFQVISHPLAGREAEYDRWYNEIHVHEVLALPGFNSCERFLRDSAEGKTDYIAVYEVETDDPQALLQSLFAASATMRLTDALDTTTARFEVLRPAGSGKVLAKA